MTGTTGKISCETVSSFLGTGMVPKSQVRQTLVTMPAWKAEPFTLNSRQTSDSMWAIVSGKAQGERRSLLQILSYHLLNKSFLLLLSPVFPLSYFARISVLGLERLGGERRSPRYGLPICHDVQ